MLRIFIGVFFEVFAFDFIEVEVVFGRLFSGSELSRFKGIVGFLTTGAINFTISF